MSNVYDQEPSTTGRLIFRTTYGDLEADLWCKECPKACRNFIQLALEGYYDNTLFHRIVHRFCIQGGDPTGTGNGGDSIYASLFPVESHSRLKFNRRGLLAMVNMNDKGCGSQFFFTLDEASELDRRCTVFGKVAGDTVFNLLRMGELETDPEERPLNPPLLKTIEVVVNPFDGIVPREIRRYEAPKSKEEVLPVQKLVPKRDKKLLSFLDEEDELDPQPKELVASVKSSHEPPSDPSLVRTPAIEPSESSLTVLAKDKIGNSTSVTLEQIEQMREDRLTELRKNIEDVKRNLRGEFKSDSFNQELSIESSAKRPKSFLKSEREAYKQKGRAILGKRKKTSESEMETLLALNTFREKLKGIESENRMPEPRSISSKLESPLESVEEGRLKQVDICKLHGLVNCESCHDTFGMRDESTVTDEGWLLHKLVFDKDVGYQQVKHELDKLVVIDPREKAQKILANTTTRSQ